MQFDRKKFVAIITGAIALLLGIAYLTVVQLLDFRGEMIPAPESLIWPTSSLTTLSVTAPPSLGKWEQIV